MDYRLHCSKNHVKKECLLITIHKFQVKNKEPDSANNESTSSEEVHARNVESVEKYGSKGSDEVSAKYETTTTISPQKPLTEKWGTRKSRFLNI